MNTITLLSFTTAYNHTHIFFSSTMIRRFCVVLIQTLKEIYLYGNKIGDEGVKSLAEILRNKTVIKFLFLYFLYTKYSFLHIQALEKVELSRNGITNDGAQYLALALRNNTVTLIHINLIVFFLIFSIYRLLLCLTLITIILTVVEHNI